MSPSTAGGGRPVLLVMGREIRQRFRSKAFAVTTVGLVLVVLAIGILTRVLSGDDDPTRYDYAVAGVAPDGFGDAVQAAASVLGIELRAVDDGRSIASDRIEPMLRDGTADAVVDATDRQLVTVDDPHDDLAQALDLAWRSASARAAAVDAGLEGSALDAVLAPPTLDARALDSDQQDDEDPVAVLAGTVVAILLFISINAFGGMVLTGVVEEKSTGVVEVLLAHVRAHELLIGKVLGIATVALTQFAAALAAGVVSLRVSGRTVPGDVWLALPSALGWFLVGFVLYSTLFALAGSFVSRQEDAQGAAAPITMVMTAAYLAVFSLGNEPSSLAARIVSVIPPFAPLLMPLRIATGSASVLEIVAAAALLLGGTYGMLRLAGAVYGRTLLHRGSRLRWREALRTVRQS